MYAMIFLHEKAGGSNAICAKWHRTRRPSSKKQRLCFLPEIRRRKSKEEQKMKEFDKTPSPLTGKIEWKGSALLGPVPAVMVTCGPVDAPNIITISWTGICCTRPPVTYIAVRPQRHSHRLIREGGCFVINLVPAQLARACDYCGTYTGAKVDKFARLGLTPVPSETVNTAMIAECPVSVSCRVRDCLPLGSHDLFLADIVGISVDPRLLDGQGRLHMEGAGLLCAMHGAYYALGEQLAVLGCSTKLQNALRKPRRAASGKGENEIPAAPKPGRKTPLPKKKTAVPSAASAEEIRPPMHSPGYTNAAAPKPGRMPRGKRHG